MLILLRYASLILAIILMLSLIFALSVMIKSAIESRFQGKTRKSKQGNLPSDAGVRDLILSNQIQEAIDLYQRFTGVDEFTAKMAIEDMEREIRLSTIHQGVADILKKNGKAAAIEAYQTETGANLADALSYVEEIERAK